MLTFELLDTHRDTLRERRGTIIELLQRMEKLAAEGKEAATKVTRLQADLDHEAVVQRGQEVELERLQGEFRERETLQKQLSDTRGELEKKISELWKDSELQAASSDLQRKDSEL